MGMNEQLAAAYGTVSDQENQEKLAEAEFFCKLAAENGVDLTQLPEAEVTSLWNDFQAKIAEAEKEEGKKAPPFGKKDEKDEDEKKEAAAREFAMQKEAQAKIAEADYLGRVMAHAFAQESRELTKEALSGAEAGAHLRNFGAKAKEVAHSVKDIATGKQLREGLQAKKNLDTPLAHNMAARQAMSAPKGARDAAQKAILHEAGEAASKNVTHGAAKTVGLYGGAAAATGAAAAAAHKGKKKESSAIDEQAAELAVVKAASAGFDTDEAIERVSALFTLGLNTDEGSKVASADTVEGAVEIRSLELLQLAGYPVEWALRDGEGL